MQLGAQLGACLFFLLIETSNDAVYSQLFGSRRHQQIKTTPQGCRFYLLGCECTKIESASGTDAGAEGVKQTAPACCL
jgi:hypothetical protein